MIHVPASTPAFGSCRGLALKWVLFATAGLAVAGGAIVVSRGGSTTDQASIATADRTTAQKMSFEITSTAGGELEARNKVEIRSPLDRESTIVAIVPEGIRVKKGETLIQLNAEEIQDKIDEQTTRVRSARAEKVNAQNSYDIQVVENSTKLRQAELDVEVANLDLDQWRYGDDASKKQELDLAVQKATVELERLAERYARSQELVAEDFLSKNEMDSDEAAYIQAISEYQKAALARSTYASFESPKDEKTKYSAVEKAVAELQRVKLNNVSELEIKESKRDIQASEFEQSETLLAKLKTQFQNATVKAPQDGLVVYGTSVDGNRWGGGNGPFQIGQQVYSNQLLMILPDTSEMVASVRIHESIAGRITPGMPVDVKIDAAGGRVFPGTVETIGVMAESGGWRDPNLREYIVRIGLETGDAELKPAMRCEARVVMDGVEDALAIPLQAVFSDGPVRFVYEARGGKFGRVPVRVGRRSDTFAEIKAGLDPGDTVLLREPTPGEVLSEPWAPAALTLAGYTTDDKGQVIAEGGGGPGQAGGGRAGRPQRAAGPGKGRPEGTADGKGTTDGGPGRSTADTKPGPDTTVAAEEKAEPEATPIAAEPAAQTESAPTTPAPVTADSAETAKQNSGHL